MNLNLDIPHLRTNILTGEKVLVSPQRNLRPWQGQIEDIIIDSTPQYDTNCYLCPNNSRAGGENNPDYKDTYAFINDFPALLDNATSPAPADTNNLLQTTQERGICKVVVFSPRHDLTLPEMELDQITSVINLWQSEFLNLQQIQWIKYIQIFENKGAIMGCSNPHPHGQIWAQQSIPTEIEKETYYLEKHYQQYKKSLLSDYLGLELKEKTRIVIESLHFAVVVPFWASWPYETLIISKRHTQHIGQFTEEEKFDLARVIQELTIRYDNIFQTSFPYSAGMHQSPVNCGTYNSWHWHMHFYPPLLRSANIKKFMVGYEMLANPQRDITPESAAEILRNQSTKHYKSTR